MENTPKRILVACEESQSVTKAFRALGHEAYSCDLQPCSGGHPEWHVQGDVTKFLNEPWDIVVAFPPCTHLASSGARYFREKRRDGRQADAIKFFMLFTGLACPHAIENPVGIMSTLYRKPDQIIQPWQFGHPESKATCLWLHELPKLTETNILPIPPSGRWNNQTPSGQNKLGPSPNRAKNRSKTWELELDQRDSWMYIINHRRQYRRDEVKEAIAALRQSRREWS